MEKLRPRTGTRLRITMIRLQRSAEKCHWGIKMYDGGVYGVNVVQVTYILYLIRVFQIIKFRENSIQEFYWTLDVIASTSETNNIKLLLLLLGTKSTSEVKNFIIISVLKFLSLTHLSLKLERANLRHVFLSIKLLNLLVLKIYYVQVHFTSENTILS